MYNALGTLDGLVRVNIHVVKPCAGYDELDRQLDEY